MTLGECLYLRTIDHPTITHVEVGITHGDGHYHAVVQPIHRPTKTKIGDSKTAVLCKQENHNRYVCCDAFQNLIRIVEHRHGDIGAIVNQTIAEHNLKVMEGVYT